MTADRLDLSIQYATRETDVPDRVFIETCARRALVGLTGEVGIRIVDESESAALNARYRGKDGPTNVLAFPAGDMPSLESLPRQLGDIVICAAIVDREAREQGKDLQAHWAHIVIHGCLHLCGFDHEADDQALEMESREAVLLARMGIGDPYQNER